MRVSSVFKEKAKVSSHKRPQASYGDLLKQQNKTQQLLLEKSFSFLRGNHGWTETALGGPRTWVRQCNLGISLVVVLAISVMLKMLPLSRGRRAARDYAVRTDTCYIGRLNQKSGRI